MNDYEDLTGVGAVVGRDRIAQLLGDVSLLESGQLLRHHHSSVCSGTCCLHGTAIHSVCRFPRSWRKDRGILEHYCPHGVGHACPGGGGVDTLHGCDGCCEEIC